MKLSKREVELLDFLCQNPSRTVDIAKALNIKPPNIARCLKKLEKYKLVIISRQKRAKVISLDYAVWFPLVNLRVKFPSIKLLDIAVGYTPYLLSFLYSKKQFKLRDIDLPPATAKRLLKKLRGLGLVFMPLRGFYELREEARAVAWFCRQLLMRIYLDIAETELGKVHQVVYSFNSVKELECVFVVDKESKSKTYWPTAYAVFHKHGVRLISVGKYYYSNVKPKLQNVIIQTLAMGKDARIITYVCALIEKSRFDAKKLYAVKQRFELSQEFLQNLVEFIDLKGSKTFEGFPNWSEVEAIQHG